MYVGFAMLTPVEIQALASALQVEQAALSEAPAVPDLAPGHKMSPQAPSLPVPISNRM